MAWCTCSVNSFRSRNCAEKVKRQNNGRGVGWRVGQSASQTPLLLYDAEAWLGFGAVAVMLAGPVVSILYTGITFYLFLFFVLLGLMYV